MIFLGLYFFFRNIITMPGNDFPPPLPPLPPFTPRPDILPYDQRVYTSSNLKNADHIATRGFVSRSIQKVTGGKLDAQLDTLKELATSIGGVTDFKDQVDASLALKLNTDALSFEGNAATASKLAVATSIAGKSFDGSSPITIASTDLSDASNFNAPTASKLAVATTIAGKPFDGSSAITIASTDLSDASNFNALVGKTLILELEPIGGPQGLIEDATHLLAYSDAYLMLPRITFAEEGTTVTIYANNQFTLRYNAYNEDNDVIRTSEMVVDADTITTAILHASAWKIFSRSATYTSWI
jgi:hypothetical protein